MGDIVLENCFDHLRSKPGICLIGYEEKNRFKAKSEWNIMKYQNKNHSWFVSGLVFQLTA